MVPPPTHGPTGRGGGRSNSSGSGRGSMHGRWGQGGGSFSNDFVDSYDEKFHDNKDGPMIEGPQPYYHRPHFGGRDGNFGGRSGDFGGRGNFNAMNPSSSFRDGPSRGGGRGGGGRDTMMPSRFHGSRLFPADGRGRGRFENRRGEERSHYLEGRGIPPGSRGGFDGPGRGSFGWGGYDDEGDSSVMSYRETGPPMNSGPGRGAFDGPVGGRGRGVHDVGPGRRGGRGGGVGVDFDDGGGRGRGRSFSGVRGGRSLGPGGRGMDFGSTGRGGHGRSTGMGSTPVFDRDMCSQPFDQDFFDRDPGPQSFHRDRGPTSFDRDRGPTSFDRDRGPGSPFIDGHSGDNKPLGSGASISGIDDGRFDRSDENKLSSRSPDISAGDPRSLQRQSLRTSDGTTSMKLGVTSTFASIRPSKTIDDAVNSINLPSGKTMKDETGDNSTSLTRSEPTQTITTSTYEDKTHSLETADSVSSFSLIEGSAEKKKPRIMSSSSDKVDAPSASAAVPGAIEEKKRPSSRLSNTDLFGPTKSIPANSHLGADRVHRPFQHSRGRGEGGSNGPGPTMSGDMGGRRGMISTPSARMRNAPAPHFGGGRGHSLGPRNWGGGIRGGGPMSGGRIGPSSLAFEDCRDSPLPYHPQQGPPFQDTSITPRNQFYDGPRGCGGLPESTNHVSEFSAPQQDQFGRQIPPNRRTGSTSYDDDEGKFHFNVSQNSGTVPSGNGNTGPSSFTSYSKHSAPILSSARDAKTRNLKRNESFGNNVGDESSGGGLAVNSSTFASLEDHKVPELGSYEDKDMSVGAPRKISSEENQTKQKGARKFIDEQMSPKEETDVFEHETKAKDEEKARSPRPGTPLTPPSQDQQPEPKAATVVPPSPPPGPPSGLALAMSRLADLTSQMEFQYVKQMQLAREHSIIKAKISVLEKLPIGIDSYREDLEKLCAEVELRKPVASKNLKCSKDATAETTSNTI